MNADHKRWFFIPKPNPQAKLRLFCFPYSGSGAFAFRNWANRLPQEIELYAVQLPGRENRLKESPYTNLPPLIEVIKEVISPYLDIPFALFGHSLGAIIAFEVARALRCQHQITPQHLFVSARVAPQVPERKSPMYSLPDAEFIEKLHHFGGTPIHVFENKELMELLLPVLRADFELNETYVYQHEDPLDCPISSFRGANDDIMTYDEVVAWSEQTKSSFMLRTLPGGHFFIQTAEDTFWQILLYDLRQSLNKLR